MTTTTSPASTTSTDKALWDGFHGEIRADYADLMEQIVGLPQRPRTERGMTAWADHARSTLLDHAAFCARRGLAAAVAGNVDVARSWKHTGTDALKMAHALGDLMGLPAAR